MRTFISYTTTTIIAVRRHFATSNSSLSGVPKQSSRMSSDLIAWTKEHFDALFTASDEEFEEKFESTYSKNLVTTINGEQSSREDAKETTRGMRAVSISTQVEFGDLSKELKESDGPHEEGTVKGSYTITRSLRFRIRVTPAQLIRKLQFTARIESDPSVEGDDKRRVVSLDEVLVEEHPGKIHLSHLPVQPKATE